MKSPEEEGQRPVIRDRRRIDPRTGQVRDVPGQSRPGRHSASKPGSASPGGQGRPGGAGNQPGGAGNQSAAAPGNGPAAGAGPAADSGSAGPPAGGDAGATAATADALARLAERTADLQRLQAEYANYRKRVERDRLAVREQALASVLSELLPVLDDIGRAREHGELSGGFKSVAESLEASATKLGLTPFGEAGDPFDPTVHDALMHSYSAEVTEPTAVQILQPGYKVGDRIIRPARVAVAEPAEDAAPAEGDPESGPDGSSGSGTASR
ncbi:MAG TPA: nucleotide exchange factor GrpE [Streptosporangiaceae bacterium]|jgi:molecular chaperone GrpE